MKQEVVETQSSSVDDTGSLVRSKTSSIDTTASGKTTAANAIWYIYGIIAILLGIRFLLKILGANPGNGFVDFIYTISRILSAPFDTIFGVEKVQAGVVESVFEPSILVAIAVYALIAWGLARALRLNEN